MTKEVHTVRRLNTSGFAKYTFYQAEGEAAVVAGNVPVCRPKERT